MTDSNLEETYTDYMNGSVLSFEKELIEIEGFIDDASGTNLFETQVISADQLKERQEKQNQGFIFNTGLLDKLKNLGKINFAPLQPVLPEIRETLTEEEKVLET